VSQVVVVGSINADLVVVTQRLPKAGETTTGGKVAQHGGGKGANQAVAAARLGADVTMVGAVGDDDLGGAALRALRDEGIDIEHIAVVEQPTGVALIVVDEHGENQIAVASGANGELFLGDNLELHGDGVMLLGHEVPPEVVERAGRLAADAGWRVVLNPAPARELADIPAYVLTPNASEAAELSGEDDPEQAARVLSERTGAAVLITLGADGALLLEPGGEPTRLPATKVDVVDTTGAGDTVNGALAAELARGASLPDAARFALAAAAISTTKPGARGGMPRREEVRAA
jgi:ribokinase